MSTGWIGEGPDAGPALPVTEMLLNARAEPGAVDPLERARAAADEPDDPFDADERASNMVAGGYSPGQVSQLSQGIAEDQAELAGLQETAKRAASREVRAIREHQAGRVDVNGLRAMMDGEEPDLTRMAFLERRIERRRQELAEVQQRIAPQQERKLDGVEAASRDAADLHRTFIETTRQRMAEPRESRQAPPPFADSFPDGGGTEPTGASCELCARGRARDAARQNARMVSTDAGTWAYDKQRDEMNRTGPREQWPVTFDGYGREIVRAVGYNNDGVYGNHNPISYR